MRPAEAHSPSPRRRRVRRRLRRRLRPLPSGGSGQASAGRGAPMMARPHLAGSPPPPLCPSGDSARSRGPAGGRALKRPLEALA